MGRILVVLVSVGLILNVLTFLFVVTQGPEAETGAAKRAIAAGGKDSRSVTQRDSALQAVSRGVRGLQRDVKIVIGRLNSLDSNIKEVSRKVSRNATAPAYERRTPAVPKNTGDREFQYSDVPEDIEEPEAASGGEPASGSEGEREREDEGKD